MKYGLTRLVLIDSYLPGRVYEVDLNGHTNILGGNAAGKTSLIKLIVMFYGESPFALGIKEIPSSKHLGFTQRYLPRTGSYVIFEYLVNGKLRTLVYTGNLNQPDKYHRYFVPGGYKLEDFWDNEAQSTINSVLWRKLAKVRHASKIREVTTDIEHTEVLLGGKDHMYGMGPRQLDMTRMKKLMTSMFHKDAGHTELTKIIEDWINSDLQKKKEQLADGIIETAFLQSWVDEYNTLSWLVANHDQFDRLKTHLMDHDDAFVKQQSHYLAATNKLDQINKLKAKEVKAHKEKQEAINAKVLESQAEHESLIANESILDKRYTDLVAEQKMLDTTLETLQSKFPSDIKQRVEQSAQQETIAKSRNAELLSITEKQQSSADKRQKQIDSMEHEFSLKESQLQQNIANNQSESLKQQSDIKEQYKKVRERALQPLNEKLARLETQIATLSTKETELTTRLESPSLTKEEKGHLTQLETNRDELAEKRYEFSNRSEQTGKELEKAKKKHQQMYDALGATQKQQDDYLDELEALRPFINPHPDSFLAFLQNNHISWADTFGRAVRPEVLQQKNLSPEVTSEASSIFGISIDSSKLLPNHEIITDASECQSRIDEITDEIDSLANKISQLGKDLKNSEKDIKDVETEQIAIAQKLKQNTADIVDNNVSILSEDRRLQVLLDDKISGWEQELSTVSAKLLEVSQAKIAVETNIKEIKTASFSDLNNALRDIEQQFNSANQTLANLLKELPNERKKREADIQKAYKSELDAQGIDADYVTNLEDEINCINKFREAVEKEKGHYEAYQHYLASDYDSRYQPLVSEIEEAEIKRDECRAEIAKIDEALADYKTKRTVQSESHQKRITGYNSESTKLSQILEHNVEVAIDTKPVPHELLSTEDIEHRFNGANVARKKYHSLISKLASEMRRGFEKSGTGAFKHFYGHPGDKNEVILSARIMTQYFTDDKYQSDIALFMRHSEQLFKIATYVNYIERFKRMITSFNSKLNAHMSQANQFGAIDDLSVKVTFTYGNDDNWQTIKAIETEYRAWQDATGGIISNLSNTDALPKSSLIDAIERFLSLPNKSDFSVNALHEHIDFEFSINDQGIEKTVNSLKKINSEKSQISSNGVSHLIVLSIFIGILNMRRNDHIIHFNWSLDELADIDPSNILVLFKMLKLNHIHLISACTVTDDSVYEAFDNVYTITKQDGSKVLIRESDEDIFAELEDLA